MVRKVYREHHALIPRAEPVGQNFVTLMLTRDLFAVASLLFLINLDFTDRNC